jgi:hypothetical protein
VLTTQAGLIRLIRQLVGRRPESQLDIEPNRVLMMNLIGWIVVNDCVLKGSRGTRDGIRS